MNYKNENGKIELMKKSNRFTTFDGINEML